MRLSRAAVAVIAAAAVGFGMLASASPANAVTWSTVSSQTFKAYSWNYYKARIKPSGYSIPSGYVTVSATLTVKNSSGTVASNVTSYNAKPGTYTAYSTFKYRSRSASTAYRNVIDDAIYGCTIASVDPVPSTVVQDPGGYYLAGQVTYALSGTCGFIDASGNDYTADGTWTDTQPFYGGYSPPTYWLSVGESTYISLAVTHQQPYTVYTYGPLRVKYVKRTVYVAKVLNTAVMTRTEWNVLSKGDSLSWVRAVIGSSGTRYYDDGGSFLGTAYRWKNTSGSYTCIWFMDGHATDFYWYG